jgi:hypothetical protein
MKPSLVALPILLVTAWITPATSAGPQIPCGKRADIIKMLFNKYQEQPRAMAISNQTVLLEVFTSKAGSWTIIFTQPNGASCIVGAGDSWEEIPPEKNLTSL